MEAARETLQRMQGFVFQNSMHSIAAVVKRRLTHKYVDRYYSRLAALLERETKTFPARIQAWSFTRLRPSEATKCNTFWKRSGTSLSLWRNARTFVHENDKGDGEGTGGKTSFRAILRISRIRYWSYRDISLRILVQIRICDPAHFQRYQTYDARRAYRYKKYASRILNRDTHKVICDLI